MEEEVGRNEAASTCHAMALQGPRSRHAAQKAVKKVMVRVRVRALQGPRSRHAAQKAVKKVMGDSAASGG
jgi:glycine cleavage system aminomethyltransferase T